MPRYGINLGYYLTHIEKLSKKNVFIIGLALLDALETIHESGHTFNDLKPDNILIGQHGQKIPSDLSKTEVHLVDFGFTTPFL